MKDSDLAYPKEITERCRSLQPVESIAEFAKYQEQALTWRNDEKRSFFFAFGQKVEAAFRNSDDETDKGDAVKNALPYYAASVCADPERTSAAWTFFTEFKPSSEVATELTKRYPIPASPPHPKAARDERATANSQSTTSVQSNNSGLARFLKCTTCGEPIAQRPGQSWSSDDKFYDDWYGRICTSCRTIWCAKCQPVDRKCPSCKGHANDASDRYLWSGAVIDGTEIPARPTSPARPKVREADQKPSGAQSARSGPSAKPISERFLSCSSCGEAIAQQPGKNWSSDGKYYDLWNGIVCTSCRKIWCAKCQPSGRKCPTCNGHLNDALKRYLWAGAVESSVPKKWWQFWK